MYIRKVEFFDAGWRALITSAASISAGQLLSPTGTPRLPMVKQDPITSPPPALYANFVCIPEHVNASSDCIPTGDNA